MENNRNWIETILMPLVIAFVGTLSTYKITAQQEANANKQAESDRHIKILDIFAQKIASDNEHERILAINILRALDNELAEKLASAVVDTEPEQSRVKGVATKMVDTVKMRID